MDFPIREMLPEDWEHVRRIYLEGLATGHASFEVDAPAWEDWDRSHHKHSRLIACHEDRIVGWAALCPVSQRKCYAGVAEFSLYVTDSYRAKGLGKRLLLALIDVAEQNGIWSLYASTFPENIPSIRTQLACGFRVVGRRERIARHRGVWRDTLITERRSLVVGLDTDP